MTQKKLTEPEAYETPLERLLSFLRVPHKIYMSIYIAVIERRLSVPLLQNDANMALLAREVGIEPALMVEKLRSMVRMKWIELEEVGKRQSNQVFVISPIWRYKPGIDKAKFAIALQEYKAAIVQDNVHQMSTNEIYELMNSICLHTHEVVDQELCKLCRFKECETCNNRKKEVQL